MLQQPQDRTRVAERMRSGIPPPYRRSVDGNSVGYFFEAGFLRFFLPGFSTAAFNSLVASSIFFSMS